MNKLKKRTKSKEILTDIFHKVANYFIRQKLHKFMQRAWACAYKIQRSIGRKKRILMFTAAIEIHTIPHKQAFPTQGFEYVTPHQKSAKC